MVFTVTYRGKDGALHDEVVEAADRAGCVAECRKHGISPTKIAEGGKGKVRYKRGISRANGHDVRSPSQRVGRPFPQWLTAALIVVAIAGGAWWWLGHGDGKPKEPVQQQEPKKQQRPQKPQLTEKPPTKIVEQKVEPQPTNATPPKEVLEPGMRRYVQWKRPDNWDKLTRAQKTRIQPVGRVIKPIGWGERQLFKRPSDKRIERLLRIQPGQLVLGTLKYDDRFVKDFLESLKTPIEITEEDSEHDKAIKEAVKAAREDLKAAYDRGEDIAEIMTQTEKQMHELAAYKLNLSKAIIDFRRSGEHSDQDVKDYINAANIMLKEHGMEPLRFGELWFRKAQLDSNEANNEKEQVK